MQGVKPFSIKEQYNELYGGLIEMQNGKDREIMVETNLKEETLSEVCELCAQNDMTVYLFTRIENLIKDKISYAPCHTIIIYGHLADVQNLHYKFVNPGCWFVSKISMIDEFTNIYDCMFNLETNYITRLYMLMDGPAPFELAHHKIKYPGCIVQIAFQQKNFFIKKTKHVYAGH